jgi:transposase
MPAETARVAHAAFPGGHLSRRRGDELGPLFPATAFASWLAVRGRPAEAPWRLALVSLRQEAEGLSDRQAADAVRSRIDWPSARRLARREPGLDSPVLSAFHTRLVTGEAE